MTIELDNPARAADFIRLNEQWIAEHFAIEDADRALAADPLRVLRDGGHILTLVDAGQVVGVCALFRESDTRYQLARMAVDPAARGKGCGEMLIRAALDQARSRGAETVHLYSNTVLAPAIALYRKHGFETVHEGPHPKYARCNIVMEKRL
jgi:ribosomal protein S18 acetylase RimI-like enzyme